MKNWVILGLSTFAVCFGQIYESEQIGDVVDHLESKTLVVFDLDNTLMHPAQELGNDQWFRYRMTQLQGEGLSSREALDRTFVEYVAILSLTKMQHVDPCAVEIVRGIQEKGYHVMGLTARGLSLATVTARQLHDLQFHLEETAPTGEHIYLPYGVGVLYRAGVLFCSGEHKGSVLVRFLKEIGLRPDRIVFVDDKAHHVAEVEMECERAGFPFVGIRYSYLDRHVKSFDSRVADVQLKEFGKLITNETAKELINANR